MTTLTEIVAAAVIHSSSVALSHFGVTVTEPVRTERPSAAVEHVVARTPRRAEKIAGCPPSPQPERSLDLKA